MNTNQSNGGKKNSTTPNQPSAASTSKVGQDVPQHSTNQDDWRSAFLLEIAADPNAKNDLFRIFELIRGQHQSENPIPGIVSLLDFYMMNAPNTSLINNMANVRAVTRLTSFLTRLNEEFDCFNLGSDYCNVSTLNEDRDVLVKELGGMGHE